MRLREMRVQRCKHSNTSYITLNGLPNTIHCRITNKSERIGLILREWIRWTKTSRSDGETDQRLAQGSPAGTVQLHSPSLLTLQSTSTDARQPLVGWSLASVSLCVCVCVCVSALQKENGLTYKTPNLADIQWTAVAQHVLSDPRSKGQRSRSRGCHMHSRRGGYACRYDSLKFSIRYSNA